MLFDFFDVNANRAFEHYRAGLAQAWEEAVAKETASETRSEHIENTATARNASSYEDIPLWTWLAGIHIILGYSRFAET